MGLKVEFANLAYLKTTDENDPQATDEQYVQERFSLVRLWFNQSATGKNVGNFPSL